jgi:ABC-2 type transport system permease protein
MIWNQLSRMSFKEVIKSLFLSSFSWGLMLVLYWGFVRFLRVLHDVPYVGPLLIQKVISMIFLTMFGMIVFSSLLTSITTLFLAKDLSLLIYSPLRPRHVFSFKFIETTFYSSWMVLIAMIPFVMAYGHIYQSGFSFYLFFLFLTFPFLFISSALGTGVSLMLMRVFPSKRIREILLVIGILAGGGLFVLFRWMEPEKFVRADSLDVIMQYISLLEMPTSPYWPS